jgi:hypothetical protein
MTAQEMQLRDDLRQLAGDPPGAPDLDSIERRGRARRRRSLAIRGAAGLGVLVLAAGGLALGTRGSPARPARPAAATGAKAAPPVQTVAYVVAHTESALAQISRYIIRDQERSSTGPYTLWTDPRTGHTYLQQGSGASRLVAWGSTYLVARVMHWRTTQVNEGPRTWWTQVIHAAGPIQGPPPAGPYGGAAGTPAQIRAALAAGHYRIVGHRVINGHRAIGLKGPWARGYMEIWVDAGSYQPVHVVIADFADQPGPLRHDKIVASESWVARSPALVLLVNHPRIPAGFSHVPAP